MTRRPGLLPACLAVAAVAGFLAFAWHSLGAGDGVRVRSRSTAAPPQTGTVAAAPHGIRRVPRRRSEPPLAAVPPVPPVPAAQGGKEAAAPGGAAPGGAPPAPGPAPPLPAGGAPAASGRMEAEQRLLAGAKKPVERKALELHLRRFAREGDRPKSGWLDDRIAEVEKANAELTKPADPLPIADLDEAEKRRLDQLEKLRQRGAVGLLDPIAGALAWLALHQAEDGRFGEDATAARCKALGHEPACAKVAKDGTAQERFPLAATSLAVLAFLDFRDQDVRGLFEPSLARAVRWIVAQQRSDGAFPQQGGYPPPIALMALGQAAAATRRADLRAALESALAYYAVHTGRTGGYRYQLDSDADLSVTGWYVQAVEAATLAGVAPPAQMRAALDQFLPSVWYGGARFAYLPGEGEHPSLAAVGMLSVHILWPTEVAPLADEWRRALVGDPKKPVPAPADSLYALYYGVRILLVLDPQLPETWRTALDALAAQQVAKGPSAGMILPKQDRWFASRAGATITTAFAALTLEHSLYRR